MITSPSEAQALSETVRSDAWKRYLNDLQTFAAEPLPFETQGILVRVAGLVLEAAGVRLPVVNLMLQFP